MNIAFLAHDKKKELMVQFCTAYKSVLAKHNLYATATTGRLIADNTGLPITLLLSHKQGGHQQINARIAYNEIDLVLLFTDRWWRLSAIAISIMCPWLPIWHLRKC